MGIQRIDATWAAFCGLSPLAFLLHGIRVVAHHQLADYQGVWLFRHHASLCLSVLPDSVEGVQVSARAYGELAATGKYPLSTPNVGREGSGRYRLFPDYAYAERVAVLPEHHCGA